MRRIIFILVFFVCVTNIYSQTVEDLKKEIFDLENHLQVIQDKITEKKALLNSKTIVSAEVAYADSLLNAEKLRRNKRIIDFFNQIRNKTFYITYSYADIPKFASCKVDTIVYDTERSRYTNEAYTYFVKVKMSDGKGNNVEFEDRLNYKSNAIGFIESERFLSISPKVKYKNIRFWNLINEGKVQIGMTKLEAELSWGKPNDINKSTGSWGVHEQWVYDDSYLYFENGKLTSIQN